MRPPVVIRAYDLEDFPTAVSSGRLQTNANVSLAGISSIPKKCLALVQSYRVSAIHAGPTQFNDQVPTLIEDTP